MLLLPEESAFWHTQKESRWEVCLVKLTLQEILLLGALVFALAVGGLVKRFRETHPVPPSLEKPVSKK